MWSERLTSKENRVFCTRFGAGEQTGGGRRVVFPVVWSDFLVKINPPKAFYRLRGKRSFHLPTVVLVRLFCDFNVASFGSRFFLFCSTRHSRCLFILVVLFFIVYGSAGGWLPLL